MWQPMETCPEGRPVFVILHITKPEIFERIRVGDEIRRSDDGFVTGITSHYQGWLPCISWQTGKAPRTGEWILVTWHTGVRREKVRWDKDREEFVYPSGASVVETWSAWTYDLPDFVPPKKAEEAEGTADDLAGKSVDEIVTEIKRLTDHLSAALKSE